MLTLALISFVAAIVNGALGYGFSSIAVPLALLSLTNRVLNPAVVLLEVPLNAYVAWVNRHAIREIVPRIAAIVISIGPGVVLGTNELSSFDASRLKLITYLVMLPLVLLQAAGFRKALRAERTAGFAFGGFVGLLYAVTTISGPPLAMFLNNQGHTKDRFRAALGMIRLTESTLALVLYSQAGLFTTESFRLLWWMAPALLIGIPIGAAMSRRIRDESFRRVCMTFDAAVIAFGASTLLRALHIVEGSVAYLPFAVVLAVDAVLLRRFFRATGSNGTSATSLTPAQHP
jgi:uncharacterized membrane protein YfcA